MPPRKSGAQGASFEETVSLRLLPLFSGVAFEAFCYPLYTFRQRILIVCRKAFV